MQPSSFMLFFSEMVWRYIFYFYSVLSPGLNEVFLKALFSCEYSELPTELNILNDQNLVSSYREGCVKILGNFAPLAVHQKSKRNVHHAFVHLHHLRKETMLCWRHMVVASKKEEKYEGKTSSCVSCATWTLE